MTRQIAFCLIFALVLPLCVGCGKEKKGVKVDGPGVTDAVKEQETIEWGVNNTSRLLLDTEPGKRLRAAKSAGRLAKKSELTAELKAKLVDALKKMVEAEPMSDAEPDTKAQIIEEGNKALQAFGAT